MDSMGYALAAFFSEPVKIVRKLAGQMSDTNASLSASALGNLMKTHPDMAAFVNGFMIRYLDFNNNDISKEGGPHPSDMIAAIMAISEALHMDGKILAQGFESSPGSSADWDRSRAARRVTAKS